MPFCLSLSLTALIFFLCIQILNAQQSSVLRVSPHTADTVTGAGTTAPGVSLFTPEQDKNFYGIKDLPVTARQLFGWSLRGAPPEYSALLEERAATASLLEIRGFWRIPTLREQVEREAGLAQALMTPVSRTPVGAGVQVGFSYQKMLAAIGFIPDYTPKITYTVEESSMVDIALYSPQAARVADIFHEVQQPGTYARWCIFDKRGKRIPRGMYSAEAQIGTLQIVRKQMIVE